MFFRCKSPVNGTIAGGGGTEVMTPVDLSQNYNQNNRQLEFEDVETIDICPFKPNQCIVFVKTFNSLHAVRPMQGGNNTAFRKTLTINIEHWGR